MNPKDNVENLSSNYLETLAGLSARLRRRFEDGIFSDANPDGLFSEENIDRWRHLDRELPQMLRIVVAVDPSGADDDENKNNDAIGIVVAVLGVDGNCYILEDCTITAGPGIWGRLVTSTFERYQANSVVGETNYGGAMVKFVIQTSRPGTPFLPVSASRGKSVRAEPVSALYEEGKVRHVGYFREMEEELMGFSTHGYVGAKSPNRADALVWAITALFPGATKKHTPNDTTSVIPVTNHFRKS
jgi:phage terminase large subunit-like protein